MIPQLKSTNHNPYTGRVLSDEFWENIKEKPNSYKESDGCTTTKSNTFWPKSKTTLVWLYDYIIGKMMHISKAYIIPENVRKELIPSRPCENIKIYRGIHFSMKDLNGHVLEPFIK